MKKRFFVVYTIFASLFILFSLSFLGFNLYKEYKEGDSRSRTIFANTVYNLYSDLADEYSSGSEFYQNISASAGTLQNYSFYEIQENNKIIYSYPGNLTQIETTSKLTKNFSTKIEVNNKNYLISCNIYLLRPHSIFHYSKITFLMILGITLLTVILIIITKESSSSTDMLEDLDIESELLDKDNFNEDDNQIESNDKYENDEDNPYSYNDIISNTENENFDISSEEKSAPKENEPEGLFSSKTGFGWESYLITRLNNEINRAIASEMDISLFIIKLSQLSRDNPLTKKICDYIASQFQFRDLLFEYKEDCLVAIKTGDNLEEALNFAETIHEEISKILDNNCKCYIGITTRSVRMISAERFLKEAEQALLHAEEDNDNPIIAFKADVEKYRKYIEQKFDN